MGIEKGRPSEQSPKMKGIFYEAMQEKKLSESPKPLILLGFSKSSVSPLAPNQYNPNPVSASSLIHQSIAVDERGMKCCNGQKAVRRFGAPEEI